MKRRNSNVEILRIISMIMILISHYSINTGIVLYEMPISFNRFMLEILKLGNIGVIIFLLITGYYGVNKEKAFSFRKIFNLYLEVLFYSIIIFFIFVLFGYEKLTFKGLLLNMFPITFNSYWFISVYFILYLFMDFINLLIKNLTKEKFLNLIIILFIVFSIIKTITFQSLYCNELIQLLFFYLIGAYIGKYESNINISKKKVVYLILFCAFIMLLSVLVFDIIGLKYSLFAMHSNYLFSRTSPLSIIISTLIFLLFIKKESFNSNTLNFVSSFVLSVYLISDNNYVRDVLWTNILKIKLFYNSPFLFLHLIFSIFMVFIICIIIDFFRTLIFSKLNDKISLLVEKNLKNIKKFILKILLYNKKV